MISHFAWLKDGSKPFHPTEHLNAYRSWLLARCRILWPVDDVARTTLNAEAKLWESVVLPKLHDLLHMDEWDFFMTERCLAAVMSQLREQPLPEDIARPQHGATAMDEGSAMTDSEPDPEVPAVFAETPKFHVVHVPEGCAAILYPPDHSVSFVRIETGTTVQQLLEAESRLYGFEWTQVSAFKMDGTLWQLRDIICPGQLAQMCVIPHAHAGDPEYFGSRTRVPGFPGECGHLHMQICHTEQPGESGLLPFKLPVNDAARVFCAGDAFPRSLHGDVGSAGPEVGEYGPLPFKLPVPCHDMPGLHDGATLGEYGPLPCKLPVAETAADSSGSDGVPFAPMPLPELAMTSPGESRPLPFKLPGSRDTHDAPASSAGDRLAVIPPAEPDEIAPSDSPHVVSPQEETKSSNALADSVRVLHPNQPGQSLPCSPHALDHLGESGPSSKPMPVLHGGSVPIGPVICSAMTTHDAPPAGGVPPCASVARSPLVYLDAVGLGRMQCSFPTTQAVVNSMRQQVLTVEDRKLILDKQGALWADDEIAWHLANIRRLCAPCLELTVIDPLLVFGWVHVGFDNFHDWLQQHCPKPCSIATVVYANQHWIPVFLKPMNGTLFAHTWDSQQADHGCLDAFFAHLAGHFGLRDHQHIRLVRMFDMDEGCGAMAVAFLAHTALNRMLPNTPYEVVEFHNKLREQFCLQGLIGGVCSKPWLWGNGPISQVEQELAAFLIQQGVPVEQSANRAKSALQAIGAAPIAEALQSRIPWKQLKTLGNQVKYQFLLPSELKAKIAGVAGKTAIGRPKGGKKSKRVPPEEVPIELDPTKFAVQPGVFQAANHPLTQIQLSDVGPLAEGFCFATRKEAEPYLKHGQPVSQVPLALLIPQCSGSDTVTALPSCMITVPCRCVVNQEPLLVDVMMVQIGQGFVEKAMSPQTLKVDAVEAGALKLIVFRDEIEGSWESFTQAPMRYIVHHMPLLRLCKEDKCTCPHWHNHEGLDTCDALLDVWRRQYLKPGYRPDNPSSASMYGVFIRTPKCFVQPLLKMSGVAGIYTEPRTIDGRSIDDTYAIVWLARMGREALNHVCRTNPAAIGLARVGERMGIRTSAAEAANLSKTLRPDAVYLAAGPKQQFLAGPFPFGSDRGHVLKALRAMQWEARPLQPLSSIDNKGSMWLIQATECPPSTLIPMSHGDVVISMHKAARDAPDLPQRPIASNATIALCGSQAPASGSTGSTDPWLATDPWGGYAPSNPPKPDVSQGLQQIKSQIREEVLKSLPAPETNMETDDTLDRIQSLESQMQTLMQKHSTLESNVIETANRQSQQLASVQSQLQVQGSELRGHIETQQQNLQALFESQMSQIRGLLKRPRDDNE